MSNRSDLEKHALNLGKLVGNLLTIEMAARMFIAEHEAKSGVNFATQLPTLKAGDLVENDAFSNPDDLRQTLRKYNKRAPSEYKIAIDEIVNLRDALAHGRSFGFGNSTHLRLLKFSRKKIGEKIKVEQAKDMDDAWFSANILLLNLALEKLTKSLNYEQKEFI
ncbi:hypothetical protein [Pseudomonas saudiphocaensis]|uniref:hypothetical protein n=1 Tax=Pseudomonas saudiphocaensis TaxID=1499686 RepID=UPI000F7B3657|nr:hypothetical protein [Pseudomonas saudiphocaensis]RRV17062.1 hypothetical protein EGJ00_06325 [Pseudomonas saudiphocaensis]